MTAHPYALVLLTAGAVVISFICGLVISQYFTTLNLRKKYWDRNHQHTLEINRLCAEIKRLNTVVNSRAKTKRKSKK